MNCMYVSMGQNIDMWVYFFIFYFFWGGGGWGVDNLCFDLGLTNR